MSTVWYAPRHNVIGLVNGSFIEFYWNGKKEESFFWEELIEESLISLTFELMSGVE